MWVKGGTGTTLIVAAGRGVAWRARVDDLPANIVGALDRRVVLVAVDAGRRRHVGVSLSLAATTSML